MFISRNTKTLSNVYIEWVNDLLDAGVKRPKDLVGYYYSDADQTSVDDAKKEFVKANSKMRVLLSTVGYGMGIYVKGLQYVIIWAYLMTF